MSNTQLKAVANNPAKKGQLASRKLIFGDCSRYAVAAIHTRFEAVEWFVWDAEQLDAHGFPEVIRQEPTLDEALKGLAVQSAPLLV